MIGGSTQYQTFQNLSSPITQALSNAFRLSPQFIGSKLPSTLKQCLGAASLEPTPSISSSSYLSQTSSYFGLLLSQARLQSQLQLGRMGTGSPKCLFPVSPSTVQRIISSAIPTASSSRDLVLCTQHRNKRYPSKSKRWEISRR